MRHLHLLLLCTVLACGVLFSGPALPTPQCTSPCGATLREDGDADCAAYAEAEARAVDALQPLFAADLCDVLDGAEVIVRDTSPGTDGGWWPDGMTGQAVAAEYGCQTRRIVLAAPWWDGNTALAHELAHLADCPSEDRLHATWTSRGIWAALEHAR